MQVQGSLTNELAVSMVTKQQTEVHCGQKAPCPGISSPTGFIGDIVTGNATHRLVSLTFCNVKFLSQEICVRWWGLSEVGVSDVEV